MSGPDLQLEFASDNGYHQIGEALALQDISNSTAESTLRSQAALKKDFGGDAASVWITEGSTAPASAEARSALRRALPLRLGAGLPRGGHRARVAQLPWHLLRSAPRELRRQIPDPAARHPRQTHHRLCFVARAACPNRSARRRPGQRLAGAQPVRRRPLARRGGRHLANGRTPWHRRPVERHGRDRRHPLRSLPDGMATTARN